MITVCLKECLFYAEFVTVAPRIMKAVRLSAAVFVLFSSRLAVQQHKCLHSA
jgi:hypothetical protein